MKGTVLVMVGSHRGHFFSLLLLLLTVAAVVTISRIDLHLPLRKRPDNGSRYSREGLRPREHQGLRRTSER